MRVTSFTPEELEELKRIDAELDAAPLTLEDYEAQELVEGQEYRVQAPLL